MKRELKREEATASPVRGRAKRRNEYATNAVFQSPTRDIFIDRKPSCESLPSLVNSDAAMKAVKQETTTEPINKKSADKQVFSSATEPANQKLSGKLIKNKKRSRIEIDSSSTDEETSNSLNAVKQVLIASTEPSKKEPATNQAAIRKRARTDASESDEEPCSKRTRRSDAAKCSELKKTDCNVKIPDCSINIVDCNLNTNGSKIKKADCEIDQDSSSSSLLEASVSTPCQSEASIHSVDESEASIHSGDQPQTSSYSDKSPASVVSGDQSHISIRSLNQSEDGMDSCCSDAESASPSMVVTKRQALATRELKSCAGIGAIADCNTHKR